MRLFKTYIILLFIITLFYLQGCIEELVAPDNNVNGTIYVNEGFEYQKPPYFWYIVIKAGNYPILYLETPPYFNISVTSKPYDLNIMFPYDSSYYEEPSVFKYIGLTTTQPKIIDANYETNERFLNRISLSANFPELKENKFIFLKFLSKEHFRQDYYLSYLQPGSNSAWAVIQIPRGKNSINGKLIYLEASEISSNRLRFDKFGIKDVTLFINNGNQIDFNENELNNNLTESTSISRVTFPPASYPKSISLILDFEGYTPESNLELFDTPNFLDTLHYPILNFTGTKYKLHSTYKTPSINGTNKPAENWKYFNPGNAVELQHYEIIQAYSPPENSIVDSNSVFEIADNLPPGIYSYDIQRLGNDVKCIRIITTRKMLLFSDFITEGFEYIPGQRYLWNVKKHIGYNNMDEFVSKIYTVDKVPSALSPGRIFTVKEN